MEQKEHKKDKFFERMEAIGLSLSYGEVRLKSGESETPPSKVCIKSRFSRRVALKCPIVGAAMEITESALAIAFAKLGGIGIIHSAQTPERQAWMVAKVKRHLGAKIDRPITIHENDTMGEIKDRMEKRGYGFNSFPVVGPNLHIIGIITGRDFSFCHDSSKRVGEVMSRDVITASADTDLRQAYEIMARAKKKTLPLVDADRKIAGLYVYSDVDRILFGNVATDMYNTDGNGHLRVAAAIGSGDEELEKRATLLVERGVDALVIDSAVADTKDMRETLVKAKERFPDTDIVIGNISEPESALRLAEAGADGIKVGQGPGSICTTRLVAGYGCPQLTAVYECARALRGRSIPTPVLADGGITYSGDIPVAIGAGGDCVVGGRLFAGADEAAGEEVTYQGQSHKKFRGMASLDAMEASKTARARYRQADTAKAQFVAEGVEGLVPCSGPLASTFIQLTEGLRRGMGAVGAASIQELQLKADFRRASATGAAESHPHGIVITREPPNYSVPRKTIA